MKIRQLYFVLTLLIFQNTFSQDKAFENDVKETIDWINKKFNENKKWREYTLDSIEFINNEPILIMYIKPGGCFSIDTCKIPLKKISSLSYEIWSIRSKNDTYELSLKTKNNEEVVWYRRDEMCGQIGDEMTISLNTTIEGDDLMNRIKNALSHLMYLYDNNNFEKF